ncbi:peptidoglycan editing factor PgeF [Thermus thermamylovorans]|uniref:Purine nucleoside phosphorylase n=1 Tax=Thermus thermamylovorans TaxID=2509362 RepID=A0A4Q9AYI4_9DEIN|nr:peptidoglycan editing factor PgeF [Thermus thermamylovorans]TBH15474.1 peptidoglycan editing factor PgeF [Thermus thermamylovorans]
MVLLLTTPLPVPHGFTTRLGGVSEGPFYSLNLSAATGDDPGRVEENQKRVLAAFGHPPVAALKQVHGSEVHRVEGPGVWEGDGLFTQTPGLLLRVGVADCYPLLLYHPQGAVAALHAGWRGVVGGILPKALALLGDLGLDPAEAHLAVGPGIGGGCYQVGEEVAAAFGEAGLPTFTPDPKAPGKYLLDLEGALLLQARRAGLREERIHRMGLCTHCEPTLFSHRRDRGRTGRMWGLVLLPR